MKVWILQTGEPLQIDIDGFRPMRAMNLADQLTSKGHEVVLWSSDFNHFTKKHRFGREETIQVTNLLKIKLIPSRGYLSHNGFARLIDHAQLGVNLSRMLRREKNQPDVAFVGYPPIESAWVMIKWLKSHRIPTILDVKDAWPDVLINHFPSKFRFIAKLGFFPYYVMMRQTFKKTSAISSVTQEFLDWCLLNARRKQNVNDQIFPLTSPNTKFTKEELMAAQVWWENTKVLQNEIFRGYFVGSISDAFDFSPIIEASKRLPIEFVIAGDGPRLEQLRHQTRKLGNIFLPGRISSSQAHVLASKSDFAIAPLKKRVDFEMSIPNKFYDAMKFGKPMITSLDGPAADVLSKNECGINYKNDDNSLYELLCDLIEDPELINRMSVNAKITFENLFQFEKVYADFILKLENLK
jgi:glycosyltransferase involved in cell wall biosynthesis